MTNSPVVQAEDPGSNLRKADITCFLYLCSCRKMSVAVRFGRVGDFWGIISRKFGVRRKKSASCPVRICDSPNKMELWRSTIGLLCTSQPTLSWTFAVGGTMRRSGEEMYHRVVQGYEEGTSTRRRVECHR